MDWWCESIVFENLLRNTVFFRSKVKPLWKQDTFLRHPSIFSIRGSSTPLARSPGGNNEFTPQVGSWFFKPSFILVISNPLPPIFAPFVFFFFSFPPPPSQSTGFLAKTVDFELCFIFIFNTVSFKLVIIAFALLSTISFTPPQSIKFPSHEQVLSKLALPLCYPGIWVVLVPHFGSKKTVTISIVFGIITQYPPPQYPQYWICWHRPPFYQ